MPESPKISIITVCYNSVSSLEDTILSIIDQNYSNIEYIVIDGHSNDGTVEIIKRYASDKNILANHKHSISLWISEPDKGIYDAMNKGIAMASGDYIIFINSEDKLINIPVEELKMNLTTNCAGVCGSIICENNRNILPHYDWKMKIRNQLPHQALFYKRNCLEQYDTDLKIVADYDYNLKLYLDHKEIITISNVISYHVGSISGSNLSAKESFSVIRKRCGIKWLIFSFLFRKVEGIKARIQNLKKK